MNAQPAVSVVLPVYNREELVARAIASNIGQRFEDFELIVVDDGSTDATQQVVRSFADRRLKLVSLPANGGNARARNAGIDLARGEFIATMDSDDVTLPERLGKQVSFLRANPRVAILGTQIIKCQRNGVLRPKYCAEDGIIKARLLMLDGSAMIHPSTMMRASFLDEHRLRYPDVPTDVDHALWIEAMALGARFSILQDYLLEYHRHGGNLVVPDGPGFLEHERRKSPMRARILGLFFPALSEAEAMAIARWMEHGRRNSKADVLAALEAIRKTRTDDTSRLGESKAEVHRILEGHMNSAEATLRSAQDKREGGAQ